MFGNHAMKNMQRNSKTQKSLDGDELSSKILSAGGTCGTAYEEH